MPLYPILRSLLFRLDSERAHALTLSSLDLAHRLHLLRARADDVKQIDCIGLRFANRVGLAAGLDKNASCIDALGALGFGFIEVGTVTPRPQSGQPRPRLFRVPECRALINRMGFPNDGAEIITGRLARREYRGICGVNIGKNATTPLEEASADYLACLRVVGPHADYVAINVSSPNTPDLRRLQDAEHLEPMLDQLLRERDRIATSRGVSVPLLVKVSPDSSEDDQRGLARRLAAIGVDGIIATNTTVTRPPDCRSRFVNEEGGLSGAPLRQLALRTLSLLRAEIGRTMPIIAAGGIDDVQTARETLQTGADLVQVYTGLIYRGPRLVTELCEGLRDT